jgi:hypothetical protein
VDLVSSLIDLELADEVTDEEEITTEDFGKFWVQYKVEKRRRFECSVVDCEKLAKRLRKSWHIEIIQVIGKEFIALDSKDHKVLLHVTLLPNHQFELTIRAKCNPQDISVFLQSRQLS